MASNSSDDEHSTTSSKLLYEAMRNAAEQRERAAVAPLVPDRVLSTRLANVEYHAAVMEYFNRLSPHLLRRPVFWDEVPLYSEPIDGVRDAIADAYARYYGITKTEALDLFDALEDHDEFPDIGSRQDETVRGLRNLVHWRNRTESYTVESEDIIDGESVEEYERQQCLPREVAMTVHDKLDEAAASLGFNTSPGKDIPETRLRKDGEMEVVGVRHKQ